MVFTIEFSQTFFFMLLPLGYTSVLKNKYNNANNRQKMIKKTSLSVGIVSLIYFILSEGLQELYVL